MGPKTTLPGNQGRRALVKQVSENLMFTLVELQRSSVEMGQPSGVATWKLLLKPDTSGKAHSYLAALWSPLSPGCRSVSLCLAWSAAGAALFPAVVWCSLRHGFSPAAHDSCSPAGSWTSPSLCGSSSNAPPCRTQHAEGRWIPSAVRTRLCEMVFLNCNAAQKTQSHSI